MDSLFNDKAIPFEQELRHTKLYLELEQLRYEDALQVSYDLQCTEFNIPTLTLQPLVENAVRHGVRGKLSGRGRRSRFQTMVRVLTLRRRYRMDIPISVLQMSARDCSVLSAAV